MRRTLAFAATLVGLFDAAYLWWVYTSPSRPMVCLGDGCDVVRMSPFANLWGVPLAAYGAARYAVRVLLVFTEAPVSARLNLAIRSALAGISGAGFLVSLYLT